MKKIIFTLLLLLLIVPFMCFGADTIVSTAECVLMVFPRSIVNNNAKGIELSQAKSFSVNDLTNPLTFSSESTNNLSLFRLYDTLKNRYTTIPAYSSFSRYADEANANTENSAKVRIYTTGIFAYEEDPTIVRDFRLETIFTRAQIDSSGSQYSRVSGYPIKMTQGTTYNLEGSAKTYFKNIGGSNYELYIPSSPLVGFGSTEQYRCYAMYMRLYDICIALDDIDTSGLPSGYYTTTITLESEQYQNRRYIGFDDETGYVVYQATMMQISETFTIRGYIETLPTGESFLLSLSASTDTFTMDLGLNTSEGSDKYYDVANVSLYNLNISTTEPNSAIQEAKYTVYISPTENYESSYTPNGSSSPFYFYKRGTENATRTDANTVYYDLYVNDGSSYKALKNSANTYNTSQEFGGAGVKQDSNNSVYYIRPYYYYVINTYSSSANNDYFETWKLNTELYLRITDESLEAASYHSPGEYQSTIWFTLVVT